MAHPDPYGNFRFRVEIDGLVVGEFAEVTGLVSESEVIAHRDGTDPARVRRVPGIHKVSDITMKRGLTADRSLWMWRKAIIDGQVDRRDGVIMLLDGTGQPVARWRFKSGWPSKWEGPTLEGLGHDVATETLVITHDGLDWPD